MNYDEALIDDWLAGRNPEQEEVHQEVWDPGFEAERQVILSKFGPYNRLFHRPENFVRHFYHHIYPLTIEDWNLTFKTSLHGGFCTIDSNIEIRYQPTVRYAQDNREILSNVHQHIQNSYSGLIRDLVDKELLDLDDGNWVHSGLGQVENRIMNAVNEALMLQKIHCRSICSLVPVFIELADDSKLDAGFIQESIYLNVMQKNFEFREKQELELLRQQEEQEKLELERQKVELEKTAREDVAFREMQALQAEQKKQQLEEKELQTLEQFKVEERMLAKQSLHEERMREIQVEAEMQGQEKLWARQEEMQTEELKHKQLLKEREQQEEIEELEKQQVQWHSSKERLHQKRLAQEQHLERLNHEAELKNLEQRQVDKQELEERLLAEKLKHQSRLKGMELEMEVKDHEKRFETSNQTSEYLRREIELLVLEKQRIELNRAIKSSDHYIAIEADH